MIFKKIFKGTDLDFDISLEKTDYTPGETVRGRLALHTEKSSRARQLKLFAEGKESTTITVEESSRGYGSSSNRWDSHTYTEVNTFFSEDLSHLLQKSVSSNTLEDGNLELLPQTKEIAVEFTLPSENRLFSSYKGKHANITYTLKATVDVAKKLDVNKEEIFSVITPINNKVRYMPSREADNRATLENENMSFPSTSGAEPMNNNAEKESYSARFERMFGKRVAHSSKNRGRYPTFHDMGVNFDLGALLTKGREKYLKENSEARIDLLNHGDDNNSTVFSPGQTLRGKVIALLLQNSEENKKENIRGMKITLSGIEHAFAQGFQRVSTIEKYENKIVINGNGENDVGIPFEFQIPYGIKQSYIGRYSEYFWGLEVKINIAWSSDIIARTIIEIV
jgi:hypothetical protein